MATATITSKGQITIPKAIRDCFGLQPGDRLSFVVDRNGTLVVKPLNAAGGLLSLAGLLADKINVSAPVTLEDMDRGIAEAVRERYLRSLHNDEEAAE